jgi:2-oxoglutarate ferredoxin oxidoreductase subunit alpha
VEPDHFRIYRDGSKNKIPYVSPMVAAGEGYRIHVTGLTHDERGYPVISAEANEWNVTRLIQKIRANREDIIQIESQNLEDAEVVVVSYGISARTSLWPIQQARLAGIKVGYLKLVTVWPFPEDHIRRLAKKIRAFVVPEINMGQIRYEVERCAAGQAFVIGVNSAGGDVLEPQRVLRRIFQAAGREEDFQKGFNAISTGEV